MFQSRFTRRIEPHVRNELTRAKIARLESRFNDEFTHLERAHVLGQESTPWHVLIHIEMARWAYRHHDTREFLGQLFRITGAATKTAFGLVPPGHTGGANVSPFKVMPVNHDLHALITRAKRDA